MQLKEKTIKTPEEFAKMTSKEICLLMQSNRAYCIVGYAKGVDRRIIKRPNGSY